MWKIQTISNFDKSPLIPIARYRLVHSFMCLDKMSKQQAQQLYGLLVWQSRLAKNIIAIGLIGSKLDGVEVCFCSEVEPSSLCSVDRRRGVIISFRDEKKFAISALHYWRQEEAEILCKDQEDLFYQLDLLAVKARYDRF